ncbi:hypothetical protein CIB84_005813, partial [Bambusicola thoracicus]
RDLIDSQHYDAAYIFRTLRRARAFHFTAMPKLVSYFLNYRTKKKIQENECKEEFKDPSNRVSSLITNDVLEELMNIHEHYQKMKCAISADKSQPDKALSLIKDEFVVSLKDIALEHQEWQQKRLKLLLKAKEADEMPNRVEEETSLRSEGSERADALARIKHRSYSAVVEVGQMQAEKETVPRHIGMPVITEEDSSDTEGDTKLYEDRTRTQNMIFINLSSDVEEVGMEINVKLSTKKRSDLAEVPLFLTSPYLSLSCHIL